MWAIIGLILSIVMLMILIAFVKWLIRKCHQIQKDRGSRHKRVVYQKGANAKIRPFQTEDIEPFNRYDDILNEHLMDSHLHGRMLQRPILLPPPTIVDHFGTYGRASRVPRPLSRFEELPITTGTLPRQTEMIPMATMTMTGMNPPSQPLPSLTSNEDVKLQQATEQLSQLNSASTTHTQM